MGGVISRQHNRSGSNGNAANQKKRLSGKAGRFLRFTLASYDGGIGRVIKTFASTATETVWAGPRSRELPPDIQDTARRKLRMLNNAVTVVELRVPPNNRLEKLKGLRAGQFRTNSREPRATISASPSLEGRTCWNSSVPPRSPGSKSERRPIPGKLPDVMHSLCRASTARPPCGAHVG